MKSKRRLGEMMTETGLVSNEQLSEALADQWQAYAMTCTTALC